MTRSDQPPSLDRLIGDLVARVANLEDEVDKLRTWRHDLPQQLLVPIQLDLAEIKGTVKQLALFRDATGRRPLDDDGEKPRFGIWSASLTMRDVYVFGAGAGVVFGLAKLLGWI